MKTKNDFDLLKESLEQVLAYEQGKLTLKTTKIKLPKPAPDITPHQIKKIRKKINMSQALFSKVLNVSTETEKKWEQGLRYPNGAALRLLQIINKNPSVAVSF